MFLHVVPKPPLSKHVRLLWYYEGYAPAAQRERLLPTGTVDVVFDLSDRPSRIYRDDGDLTGETHRGGILCGPHSRYFVLDTSKPRTVAGIHFAPGGAARFFKHPLNEMRNQHVPLDALWGEANASSIRDRVLEAGTGEASLRVLEAALYVQAVRTIGETRHKAVDYALSRFHEVPRIDTLECITGKLALSPRRFIELFNEEVGLTPKLFCRVLRFQAAIKSVEMRRAVNWSVVATDCGYFDQSHFIHDFRAFSGLSPSQYARLRGPHLNHVPLD